MSTTSNNFDQIRLVSLSTPFGLSRFFSIFVFEKIIEINYIIKISLEMHFSIPETREVKNGFKTFIVYDIYINGTFHCSLRYNQLYQFHIQLKKTFGGETLSEFPPKKLFPLRPNQIEERRLQLEKYIQIASQDSQIFSSDLFNGFLLAAQQEFHQNDSIKNDNIEVFRDDSSETINVSIDAWENTQSVLRKISQKIKLPIEYQSYFALYLVKHHRNLLRICHYLDGDHLFNEKNNEDSESYHSNNEKKEKFLLIRKLQNFESPLLTLKTMNRKKYRSNMIYSIILQKSYLDLRYDEDLFDDPAALNLIYLQTISDIKHRRIIITDSEIENRLKIIQTQSNPLKYLELARKQKFYGYLCFEDCQCDLVAKKTDCRIYAGNQELIICPNNSINEEFVFRVIRIKCWRLTTSAFGNDCAPEKKARFELSFEYLINKECLKWIIIYSNQAVLMSDCLQNMVEETLLKREGKKFRSEGLSLRYNTSPNSNFPLPLISVNNERFFDKNLISYFRQDGSHLTLSLTATSSISSANSSQIFTSDQSEFECDSMKSKFDDLKPIELNRSDSDCFNGREKFQEIALVSNGVFDEIGDDDL
ncbi:Neural proliferation differentiation and control protein 1 [Sarcoptes scabiei]|nr:Neural proliferation differentiation and control protein 1 [Sarcoptes scabiei]